ncbi:MAG: hypothetical protein R2771_06510, partial [Saprospiraceae bacterium]
MKTLKYISILIILIGVSVFFHRCSKENANVVVDDSINNSSIIENRETASEESCFTPYDGCTPIIVDTFMYIPFYYQDSLICDSLYVRIRLTVYDCGSNLVFDKSIVDPLGNCGAFDSLFWDIVINGTDDDVAKLLDILNYQGSVFYERFYVKKRLINGGQECPLGQLTADYYSSICYQWCAEIMSKPGEPLLINVSKVYCGKKCCVKSTTYCMKNGVLNSTTPVFQS